MKRLFCLLLLALPLPVHAAQAPRTVVPQAQSECFQMQFLLRLPSLEGLRFIGDVAALQKDMDAGTPPAPARIAALRQEAEALRSREARDYLQLTAMLAKMGAPITLKTWAAQCESQLAQPVAMSADESQEAKTDPDTAIVLATLDECDSLKGGTDPLMPDVAAWLHLSYGSTGVWAADVGEVTASLQVSDAASQPPRLEAGLPQQLVSSAPAGTPLGILAAVKRLEPPGGNLSGFATAASAIPQSAATQAHDALLSGFSAPSLADLTPRSLAP